MFQENTQHQCCYAKKTAEHRLNKGCFEFFHICFKIGSHCLDLCPELCFDCLDFCSEFCFNHAQIAFPRQAPRLAIQKNRYF